jgi:hypothetical protein
MPIDPSTESELRYDNAQLTHVVHRLLVPDVLGVCGNVTVTLFEVFKRFEGMKPGWYADETNMVIGNNSRSEKNILALPFAGLPHNDCRKTKRKTKRRAS